MRDIQRFQLFLQVTQTHLYDLYIRKILTLSEITQTHYEQPMYKYSKLLQLFLANPV